MPLRISELRLPLDASPDALLFAAVTRARVPRDAVESMEIVRRSLDRRRGRLSLCYTVDLRLQEDALGPSTLPGVECVQKAGLPETPLGDARLEHRPLVVGTGPAGLFAALLLARRGHRPRVLERGDPMNVRVRKIRDLNRDGVLDPESNYLFGEGGAGTFSDGKLTSRSKDKRAAFVLDQFRQMSGVPAVSYDYRPHLGSDRVRTVVGRLRMEILERGGSFHFRTRLLGLLVRAGRLLGVRTNEGDVPAEVLILAPGHSARDLFETLLAEGVPLEAKSFQLGLRVEHPQEFVDGAVWGDPRRVERLGPADYRLLVHCHGTSVFSFCMCPGGEIIPAITDLSAMNTNGMSWSRRDTGLANSGLVTTLEPSMFPGEGPLKGVRFQEVYEARAAEAVGHGLCVPGQRLLDYLDGRPSETLPHHSCRSGARPALLEHLLPPVVHRVMGTALRGMNGQLPGFLHPEALLVGPESRTSSPVRIVRDAVTLESVGVNGLYPVGEGAGYAGGIVSAAVDGVRAAQAVVARYGIPVEA